MKRKGMKRKSQPIGETGTIDGTKVTEDKMKSADTTEPTGVAAPLFPFSSSDILDIVLSEAAGTPAPAPAVNPTDSGRFAAIAENMRQAVQTATLNKSEQARRPGRPVSPVKRTPKKVTPVRKAVSTTKKPTTAVAFRNAKTLPPKAPRRVIGKEIDIRNQLLSKFTEVAAAKSALNGNAAKTRQSGSSVEKTVEKTKQLSLSSQEKGGNLSQIPAKSKPSSSSPTTYVKKGPPRVHLSLHPGKQNIAFADPARKVAGAVESMFSNAITKVLNTPISAKRSKFDQLALPSRLTWETGKVSTSIAARKPVSPSRNLRNRKLRKREYADDTSDEEDESSLSQNNSPWENECNDDSNSNNYEESEGNFDDEVKVEIISEEQETDFDYDSNPIRLAGHQILDMNDEDDQEEDPLATHQSEIDDSAGTATIKIEESGMESADTENPGSQFDSVFGADSACAFENDEAEQVTVDVKPQLLLDTETEAESNVKISNVETLAHDDSTVDPLQTVVKTETLELESNDE